MSHPMPRSARRSIFFAVISAIYQNQADRNSPLYPLALDIVCDLEMMQLFGGVEQLDAADEHRVQELWLAWQARLDGQNKYLESQMPKDTPRR